MRMSAEYNKILAQLFEDVALTVVLPRTPTFSPSRGIMTTLNSSYRTPIYSRHFFCIIHHGCSYREHDFIVRYKHEGLNVTDRVDVTYMPLAV